MERLARAYLPASEPTMDGDTSGQRIGRLADAALYPTALRAIDSGYTRLAPTTLGEFALEAMRKVEATEFGLLFIDGGGRLTFYDRHHGATAVRSTVVQASFGDAPGTIPIQELSLARRRGTSFNRAAVTREATPIAGTNYEQPDWAGDTPVEQVADDLTAQATNKGILSFPAQVGQLLRQDEEALATAEYLVNRFGAVQNRISAIAVNGIGNHTAEGWLALLGLGPLDRVAVSQSYGHHGPTTIAMELHVQGVTEEIKTDPPAWSLEFSTSLPPPTPRLWRLGVSHLGVDHLGW
jgi:hypothetical protein